MKTAGSRELIVEGNQHYVIIGSADGSYDLYAARLDHVGNFRRKWQAKEAAATEQVGGMP
jgi:hypothetical protein